MKRKAKTSSPSASEILARLREMGNPRVRAAMEHFGVLAKKAYGIPTPVLQHYAREIGRNHKLAEQLWRSGIHEARALAFFIGEPAKVTEAQMERWAKDFRSWDIVDGTCRYLFLYTPYAWKKTREWSRREEEYVKRAAFSLMAYLAVHDKQAPDAKFMRLLPIIRREATDERNFVKKAVNWALRQIGKRNLRLNRAAIVCGRQIRAMDSPAARWIAADALRELTSPAVQSRLKAK